MSVVAEEASEATGEVWHRLDRRMIVMHLSWLLAPIAATGLSALLSGHLDVQALSRVSWVAIAAVIVVLRGIIRYVTTRYRVTAERVELRSGLVFRQHRSVPRDRVRSVDLSANLVHRALGLSVVKVGTGRHISAADRGSELALDGIRTGQADVLRERLLTRTTAPPDASPTAEVMASAVATPEPPPSTRIAGMNWAWLRYAPLTIWTVLGVAVVAGAVQRALDAVGVNEPWKLGVVRDAWGQFRSVPLWIGVVVILLALLLLGVLGSLLLYVEGWWAFRLEREAGGTIRVRRGLLTTRSISLEERRLRGAEVAEPLLLRGGGGARVKAIATGMGSEKDRKNRDALLPPAPRAEARRVAAAVLRERRSPTDTAVLRPHPRVALRRRLVRGLVPVAVAVVVLVVLGLTGAPALLHAAWVMAVVLAPVAILLARDAYRSLGHGVSGGYLVTRFGTLDRRTVALRRDGVIGWTISRSPFQRRSGLATLAATTAAGEGAYKVRDVNVPEGLAFAEESVPGVLAPFLVQASARGAGQAS